MIPSVVFVILLVGVSFLLFFLFHLIREIKPSQRVVLAPLSPRGNGRPDTSVSFPLFVFEKDDCSMFEVEAPDKILCHMKPLDIENGEYLCWDANGRAVQISISNQQVPGLAFTKAEISLGEAFRRYSDVHGLDADTTGPFEQVWCSLKQAEVLPSRSGPFARLFRTRRV